MSVQGDSLYSTYMDGKIPRQALIPQGNFRFKAQSKGNYSIIYEFIRDETTQIKYLNMGQLMWVKQ